MGTEFANKHIGCTIHNCEHHCCCEDYCSLDKIEVGTLLNVDRGVPEVWGSVFDIRALLDATVKLRDGKKATDMKMNLAQELVVKKLLGKIKDTDIEKILKEYNVI